MEVKYFGDWTSQHLSQFTFIEGKLLFCFLLFIYRLVQSVC